MMMMIPTLLRRERRGSSGERGSSLVYVLTWTLVSLCISLHLGVARVHSQQLFNNNKSILDLLAVTAANATKPFTINPQTDCVYEEGVPIKVCARRLQPFVNTDGEEIDFDFYDMLDDAMEAVYEVVMSDEFARLSAQQRLSVMRHLCVMSQRNEQCAKAAETQCSSNADLLRQIKLNRLQNTLNGYSSTLCDEQGGRVHQSFREMLGNSSNFATCFLANNTVCRSVVRGMERARLTLWKQLEDYRDVYNAATGELDFIAPAAASLCASMHAALNNVAMLFRRHAQHGLNYRVRYFFYNIYSLLLPNIIYQDLCPIKPLANEKRVALSQQTHVANRSTGFFVSGAHLSSGFDEERKIISCTNFNLNETQLLFEYDFIKIEAKVKKIAKEFNYISKVNITMRNEKYQVETKIGFGYTPNASYPMATVFDSGREAYRIAKKVVRLEKVDEQTRVIKDGYTGCAVLINRYAINGSIPMFNVFVRCARDVYFRSAGNLVGLCVFPADMDATEATYDASQTKDPKIEAVFNRVPEWKKYLESLDDEIINDKIKSPPTSPKPKTTTVKTGTTKQNSAITKKDATTKKSGTTKKEATTKKGATTKAMKTTKKANTVKTTKFKLKSANSNYQTRLVLIVVNIAALLALHG